MAALIAGDQYGLSSKGTSNDNKILLFVKLTDSALRAIEEYLKNEVSSNSIYPYGYTLYCVFKYFFVAIF